MKMINPFNSITIQGRIVSDIYIRNDKNGVPFYMEFRLQTERMEKQYKKETKTFERAYDYNSIVIEGEKDVEFARKYYKKGDLICISGEARSSSYKTEEGGLAVKNYILAKAGRWAPSTNYSK